MPINWADTAVQLISSGLGTVIGAVLGYRLAISAHIRERRHDFVVEQLRDLYAPLLALRDEISFSTDTCWDIRTGEFETTYFLKHIWPLYRRLASMLSEKLWLAAPTTRAFHRQVLSIITAVQEGIDSELYDEREFPFALERLKQLNTFYEHLDSMLNTLQKRLLLDKN